MIIDRPDGLHGQNAPAVPGIHSCMAPYPEWLHIVAWVYISICLACALFAAIHTLLHPQRMWIMGLVWPITALYMGPFALYMYRESLPLLEKKPKSPQMKAVQERFEDAPPTMFQNFIAVFHCGAGCTLGDIAAESTAPTLGLIFAGEFGSRLLLDFVFAYVLGIAFQYFTIAPMRGLSFGKGLAAAAKADTISIAVFEIGMFGWMAITYFLLFPSPHLEPGMAAFWFMMQFAMIVGFFTAIPANAWLVHKGWKEKMPKVDPQQMRMGMQVLERDERPRRAV